MFVTAASILLFPASVLAQTPPDPADYTSNVSDADCGFGELWTDPDCWTVTGTEETEDGIPNTSAESAKIREGEAITVDTDGLNVGSVEIEDTDNDPTDTFLTQAAGSSTLFTINGSLYSDGTLDLNGGSTGSGNVEVTGGVFIDGSVGVDDKTLTVGGGYNINNGGETSISGSGTLKIAGNFDNSGSLSTNKNSTVEFNGDFNVSGSTQSLTGDFSLSNGNGFYDVTVNSGAVVDPDDSFETESSSSVFMQGTLTIDGQYGSGTGEAAEVTFQGATFDVNGDFFSELIKFNSTGVTEVDGTIFSNLLVTSGTQIDLLDQFAVNGTLTIDNSDIVNVAGGSLTLNGDATISGEINPNGGSIIMEGEGQTTSDGDNVQDITGDQILTLNNLTIQDDPDNGSDGSDGVVETSVRFSSSSGELVVNNLTIDEASVSTGRAVHVAGDFTALNDGDFLFTTDVTEERVLFNGSAGQTLDAPSPFSFSRVEIANTGATAPQVVITSQSDLTVTEQLTMTEGTVDMNGTLTIANRLKLDGGDLNVVDGSALMTADASSTSEAYIVYANSDSDNKIDGTVTGDLTYQRYLDGIQNWYYIAAPVGEGNNDTFNEFLQEGGNNDLRTRGVTGADDRENDPGFASVRLYDETEPGSINPDGNGPQIDAGWKAIDCSDCDATGLGSQMESGRGYAVYVYSEDDPGGGTGFEKLIDSDVEPFQDASFTFSNSDGSPDDGPGIDASPQGNGMDSNDGWNLLANPYFATINFCAITRGTGISPLVWVWDPQNGLDGQSTDGYATYNCTSGFGGGATGDDNEPGGRTLTDGFIAPQQSFFVQATSTSNLGFSIDDISSVQTNSTGAFLKQSSSRPPGIALVLSLNGMSYTTSIGFVEQGTAGLDNADGHYIDGASRNSGFSFHTVLDDGTPIVTNVMPDAASITDKTTVPLAIDACNYGDPLRGEAVINRSQFRNIPADWGVVLEDTKEGRRVDLRADSEYTFTLEGSCPSTKAKSASQERGLQPPSPGVTKVSMAKDGSGPNMRFKLHVIPNATIPVEFSSFTGSVADNTATLEWTTASEQNNAGFQVQRKVDGSFQTLDGAFVEGAGTTEEPQSYSYRVEDLDAGPHTFRLKQVDVDGGSSYSKETTVKVGLDSPYELQAYPNPISEQATITFAVKESQDVTLELYNTLGQRVKVLHQGSVPSSQTRTVSLQASNLSSGLYIVRMRGDSFSTTTTVTVVR